MFGRLTREDDRVEHFGIFELALPVGAPIRGRAEARMLIENQELPGHFDRGGAVRFRCSPKEAKAYRYTLRSNIPALDGLSGGLTAIQPELAAALRPSPHWPNWWTDDPSRSVAEGPHQGAQTVSEWREQFLRDFAARMRRCAAPA